MVPANRAWSGIEELFVIGNHSSKADENPAMNRTTVSNVKTFMIDEIFETMTQTEKLFDEFLFI